MKWWKTIEMNHKIITYLQGIEHIDFISTSSGIDQLFLENIIAINSTALDLLQGALDCPYLNFVTNHHLGKNNFGERIIDPIRL